MDIDFWFDPACPWCWITSRWLNDTVAPERDLNIKWHSISLFFKNEPDPSNPYFETVNHTHKLLRVFEAVKADSGNAAAGNFYAQAGLEIHNGANPTVTAEQILKSADLDTKHANAYDDEAYDSIIRTEMDAGLALVGQDVGTPIIGFNTPSGKKGIFGPVISKLPESTEESLKMWDATTTIASMDHFWELKRSRTQDPQFS